MENMTDETRKKHFRERNRQILLPVWGSLALFVLGGGLLFGLSLSGDVSNQQIGVVAACMVTLFILLPLVILFLVLDVLLLSIMFGVAVPYKRVESGMEAIRKQTEHGTVLTKTLSENATTPIINWRARAAGWRSMLQPKQPQPKEEEVSRDDNT